MLSSNKFARQFVDKNLMLKCFSIKCGIFSFGADQGDIIETSMSNIMLSKKRVLKVSHFSLDETYEERNFIEEATRLFHNEVFDFKKINQNKLDVI